MRRFVEEADRGQWTLLPECLDDFIDESNPVRVIDVFVDALDLAEMSFGWVEPAATCRPSYHPSVLLKLYIYGYLNRVRSSRRLELEAGRNVEFMWLLGRLAPDHKTIADFRKDDGLALREVCARFVELCREMGLLATASVAIDGSKFKAVNNRDKNFTRAKVERRGARGFSRRRRLPIQPPGHSPREARTEISEVRLVAPIEEVRKNACAFLPDGVQRVWGSPSARKIVGAICVVCTRVVIQDIEKVTSVTTWSWVKVTN